MILFFSLSAFFLWITSSTLGAGDDGHIAVVISLKAIRDVCVIGEVVCVVDLDLFPLGIELNYRSLESRSLLVPLACDSLLGSRLIGVASLDGNSALKIVDRLEIIALKLSIPPTGIARIVNRTGPAIANARIRLHKKIHKTEGSSEKFDEFIKNL